MTAEGDQGDWLVRGLRDGDPNAVREFCERYGPMLHGIADKHLAAGLRRRVGPEDVVQSACRTFVRRAQGGEFKLSDSESLWRLLCAITLTKVREQARFHLRHKRGIDRETPLAAPADQSGVRDHSPADPAPSPSDAAEFVDEYAKLLSTLDEEERQVVDLKLQDYTHQETADRLGCSERTVRRILKQVQARLGQILGVS